MNIKDYRPTFFIPSALPDNRTCRMCPTKLLNTVKYYCSGFCLNQAKITGLYGNEDAKDK